MLNRLRHLFPDKIIRIIYSKLLNPFLAFISYNYDKKRFIKHSDNFLRKKEIELLGNIIKHYHVIEKGLTMPIVKPGFGQDNIVKLLEECCIYITNFDSKESQLIHAVSTLNEYVNFHAKLNYKLPDSLLVSIDKISSMVNCFDFREQMLTNNKEYFQFTGSTFDKFSSSRRSIRNFSEKEIVNSEIINALEIAKNYPSSCNRQAYSNYVFSNKSKINEILTLQRGNRGFGHLANKLIVVTGELGVYSQSFERNQVFVDGGIYLMNLIYSLHFLQIGTCVLNCGFSPLEDKKMRKVCDIKDSEVFIAIILCGFPNDVFKIASSPKIDSNKKTKFIY